MQPSYGLTDAEMENMLEESIEFAEQDFAERQLIEARIEADAILKPRKKPSRDAEAHQLSALRSAR